MRLIRNAVRRRTISFAMIVAVLIVVTGSAPTANAASFTVRLEAGPHKGYHFTSSGTVSGTKLVTFSALTTATADLRHRIGSRIYLRITSGALAGWQVVEGRTNYVPGVAGRVAYSPARTVALAAGRYLGYRFDGDWSLGSTRFGSLSTSSTALTAERAVINGRVYARVTSGSWSGYWLPIAGPYDLSAQRIRCQTPSKVAAGSAQLISRVGATTASGEVALTFDMGGRLTPALDIMERLVIDRVCATIFPSGVMSSTTIGARVLATIADHPELFELGNHTMHHCNLRDGGGGSACPSEPPTNTFIQRELRDAQTVFGATIGPSSAPYWRPPYGAHDLRVRTAAAGAGYTKTIMWDIDTIDWRPIANDPPGPTAGALAEKVVSNAAAGSIVLMHLGGYETFDALPSMVVRLRARGLEPTSISGLLR